MDRGWQEDNSHAEDHRCQLQLFRRQRGNWRSCTNAARFVFRIPVPTSITRSSQNQRGRRRATKERVAHASTLPRHLAPEATAPWMRLYVSLITNDSTHTVTTVSVLAAFHAIVTEMWDGLLNEDTRETTVASISSAISQGTQGNWRRIAIEQVMNTKCFEDIMALVDLHRIALAYVTNKKGGDQIMDAMSDAVEQQHRRLGRRHMPFDSRLISGGIDMKDIQAVMEESEKSFVGVKYPDIADTVRNIVATSAISHGVDVDRFNSMFFAGLPSDIAEYIQTSSRVGRAHVGFVMLLPTPQNRRDRYVVETHDIFHRFLERMIAPPAVERWAETAIKRTLASHVQAWAMLREAGEFIKPGRGLQGSSNADGPGRSACFHCQTRPIRILRGTWVLHFGFHRFCWPRRGQTWSAALWRILSWTHRKGDREVCAGHRWPGDHGATPRLLGRFSCVPPANDVAARCR